MDCQSKNSPTVVYRPVRERSSNRKGSVEHTTGHAWQCTLCKEQVHYEPLIGFETEETPEQASKRHLRIADTIAAHVCKKWEPEVNTEEVSEDE